MLEAMFSAEVGDDVFGEDPTVNELEAHVADMFGHEAAIFCPSGTMANQLAIKLHTQALDEVLCDHDSHIWQYESAGFAWLSGVKIKPIAGFRGKITAAQVEAAITPRHDWLPRTRLVVLENTCNRGGGTVYTLDEVAPIRELCKQHDFRLHLDGARLMNALVYSGEAAKDWGAQFDSISLCLSKGLGAPAGSVLSGGKEFVAEARRFRKIMGGGMRQSGFLAAAGMYALRHQVDRLVNDHRRAKALMETLTSCRKVSDIRQGETNIVVFDIVDEGKSAEVLSRLHSAGLRGSNFGPSTIRLVTHLDFDDEQLARAQSILMAELG